MQEVDQMDQEVSRNNFLSRGPVLCRSVLHRYCLERQQNWYRYNSLSWNSMAALYLWRQITNRNRRSKISFWRKQKDSCTKRNRKEIITPDIVNSFIDKYKLSTKIMKISSILIYLLAFSGFMRISELLALKHKDVKFTESGMTIFIEKSKVDQLRERSTIFISKNYSDYCPVKWLRKYLQLADLTDPESFIICRLAKCKKGHSAKTQRLKWILN